MLFTDADCVTIQELADIDPEVVTTGPVIKDMPPAQGADSYIRRAVDHVGREITIRNQAYTGYLSTSPGAFANHVAAVLNTNTTAINRPRFMLNQVVAIEPNPTKTFIVDVIKHQALYYFFQALLHRKTDDRYKMKMEHYEKETRDAWKRLAWAGTPIVLIPFPCPGAIREFNSGVWDDTNVTAGGSGSTETGNGYDVQVTYTSQLYSSWSRPNNSESGPSAIVSVEAAAGQTITIDISKLNPPGGNMPGIGVADGIYTTQVTTGWNIYVAPSGQKPVLQNFAPIPIATTQYTLPNAPVANGFTVGVGQTPDYWITHQRTISRA